MEDRGLVGDIAMGILVGKIQEMLGITTTPKPRPVIGILIMFIKIIIFYVIVTIIISRITNDNTIAILVFVISIIIDGIAGLFGATTTTAAPPTDEEK